MKDLQKFQKAKKIENTVEPEETETLAINEGFAEISESKKIGNTVEPEEAETPEEKFPAEFLEEKVEMNETEQSFASFSPPSGVNHGMYLNTMRGWGWSTYYETAYAHRTWRDNPFPNLNANYWIFMGCRQSNSNHFNVGAFIKAGVLRRRGGNFDFNHNGAHWYYYLGRSVGFAPAGQPLSLGSADTNSAGGAWERISWHLQQSAGGWRCGAWTSLNGDYARRKMVMYKYGTPPYNGPSRGATPPNGVFLNRLSLKNLLRGGYKYTLNPNSQTYNHQVNDNNLWPPAHTKWMMMGCRARGQDVLTLGAFAYYPTINPHKNKYHRRRYFMGWNKGVYWYVSPGRSVGFATTGVSLNSADTRNDNGNYRMSWHFPGTGWRCGMQKGNYHNLQRVAMYYGVSTTTTTTTTTLAEMFLKTWVLPEKISWRIMQGKNEVCKSTYYDKWYAKIPTGCRLKKGKYKIECVDKKGWGWSEGYMQIKKQQLCKKFLWKGEKLVEEFTLT